MNGTKSANGTGAYTGGIPLNVTLHAWPVPKLQTEQKQFNQTNVINARNSESAKNFTNRLHNLNATGYVAIDEDLTDTGFTDVQTLILAGIATLIPLFIGVAVILGIRYLWRRYRQRKGEGYEGVLQREESSDPLKKREGHNLPLELKTTDVQYNAGGEVTNDSSPQVLTPKSNGSVITMTLKNNHLIVETEETNDTLEGIKVESQGTTTKYVTPTTSDFRVSIPSGGAGDPTSTGVMPTSLTDHGALIHYPPKDTEEEVDRESCNTGLSQSDLSVSSTESQNPSYRYGNQTGYDSGGYGYPEYSGYASNLEVKTNPNTKGPKEMRTYYRSPSMIERSDSITTPANPADRQVDILMSDIVARASCLEEAENESRSVEESEQPLRNGEALPKPVEDESTAKDLAHNLGAKGSRCDQLKKEVSPAEEIECYPNNIIKNVGNTVSS